MSRDLFWGGVPLASAGGDGGVQCSGITFEVYLRALARVIGQDVGPSGQELLATKEEGYVRTDDESGPAGALVTHGLGEVPADVAALKPGDFIQLWRNGGKGHSAIFLSHRYNAVGSIRGVVNGAPRDRAAVSEVASSASGTTRTRWTGSTPSARWSPGSPSRCLDQTSCSWDVPTAPAGFMIDWVGLGAPPHARLHTGLPEWS